MKPNLLAKINLGWLCTHHDVQNQIQAVLLSTVRNHADTDVSFWCAWWEGKGYIGMEQVVGGKEIYEFELRIANRIPRKYVGCRDVST